MGWGVCSKHMGFWQDAGVIPLAWIAWQVSANRFLSMEQGFLVSSFPPLPKKSPGRQLLRVMEPPGSACEERQRFAMAEGKSFPLFHYQAYSQRSSPISHCLLGVSENECQFASCACEMKSHVMEGPTAAGNHDPPSVLMLGCPSLLGFSCCFPGWCFLGVISLCLLSPHPLHGWPKSSLPL